jgi:putative two-component system response regulator
VPLVLLDLRMTGPTGFSVCCAIKVRPETGFVPVVLITAPASAEDRIRGMQAGAYDFLLKPVKKEELLARRMESKNPYTEGHCDRLSRYAVSLAEKIGALRGDCNDLRRSGIGHDSSKAAVAEVVLRKPGPVDAA